MPSLIAPDVVKSPTVRPSSASNTRSRGDRELPVVLEATRKVDVEAKEALGELRGSHPQVAERIDAAIAEMPNVGDDFLGFKIVLELGHGAFGRVFLAKQQALADRFVALKISPDLSSESQSLAQLQHTNIVPIYSEHRKGNLHAVCMPFFGSTTLADLCKALRAGATLPTSGKHVISTLMNRQSTVRTGHDSVHSASHESHGDIFLHPTPLIPMLAGAPANLSKIEEMSYIDAVLWMGARLADGLAHAHERGIVHRDLKPANVLLCDDGQPMLLDFNLAEDVKNRQEAAVAKAGGTLPYMAPEQLIAFRDGVGNVDGRGDVYALGLILFHLLTGQHAFPIRRGATRLIVPLMIEDRTGSPPLLRKLHRNLSPAVESIVRHCLEPEIGKRYQSAKELAEDIERHRANLPLLFAPEPSVVERAVKWSRRHPKIASPTTFSALIAAVLLLAVSISVHLSLKSRQRDLDARREQALSHYHDFQKGYHLAQDMLTTDDPVQVAEGLRHGEKALREYGVLDKPHWQDEPLVRELSPPDRARLQAEIGEIAFLIARAVHFQPGADKVDAARHNRIATENLNDGARAALEQQRTDLTTKALDSGDYQRLKQVLANAAGLNPRGRFLLACEHTAQGRYHEALTLLDASVGEDPNDFGSWSLKARCHQSLDQYTEAIAAYGTAIALRPNYARSYVARASLFYSQQTHLTQARQDLDQALKLKPDMLDAHIDRGLVLFALGKNDDSLVDLDWALEHENVPARVWFIRSRVKKAKNDREGAERDRLKGLEIEPTDPLSWVSRGMAKLATNPNGALEDFIRAEMMYPRCIEALQNQAYVYSVKQGNPAEAVAVLERLLKYYPQNLRSLGHRAVLLARQGKFDEAVAEARKVLKLTVQPEHTYRAACVLALASEQNPALKNESLRLLASAISRGWGLDQLSTDRDLTPLRETPEFKQFLGFTRLLRSANATRTP
ncbi:MAG: protein kinase [Planctomycetes bacterium]|nr:protein kinase [Planctomycetota bacterium]